MVGCSRTESSVPGAHTPETLMNRARALARHLFVEIPKIRWDAFCEIWAHLADLCTPEGIAVRDDDFPERCEPFVDWGGGE